MKIYSESFFFTQTAEGAGEPLDENLVTRLRSAIRNQLSVICTMRSRILNDEDDIRKVIYKDRLFY